MNKKILPRHAAGSFELKEGTGPITSMCSCDGFLEIYKTDKTFRVQSPEGIDPEQTNLNAMWVTTPVSDVGSQNPIVSRLLLQSNEILKAAWFQYEIEKKEIIHLLHDCKENLLSCDRIAKKVASEIDQIISKISAEGIPREQKAHGLNSFPHVNNLLTECNTFLIKANHTIKSVCALPALFFKLSEQDKNFDKLVLTLSPILEKKSPLLHFIKKNTPYIKHIIELRNSQEHPKKNKKTVIENFKCTPNLNFVAPQWYVTGDQARPIKEDMESIVSYLLEVAEAMFINLVMATVKKELPYVIEKIEETKINQDAPIKYRLSLDVTKLKFSK